MIYNIQIQEFEYYTNLRLAVLDKTREMVVTSVCPVICFAQIKCLRENMMTENQRHFIWPATG